MGKMIKVSISLILMEKFMLMSINLLRTTLLLSFSTEIYALTGVATTAPVRRLTIESKAGYEFRAFISREQKKYCSNAMQRHKRNRSEEHTSELQSRFDLVCRLLLEKKKQ